MPESINKEIEEAKKQAQHFGIDFVSLKDIDIPYEVLNIIPEEIARKNNIIVYKKDGKHLFIAVSDPTKLREKAPEVLTDLKKKEGYNFSIAITTKDDLFYTLLNYKQKRDFMKEEDENKEEISDNKANIDNTKNEKEIVTEKVFDNVSSSNSDKTFSLQSLGKISIETLLKFPKKIAQKYRMVVYEEMPNGNIKVAVEDLNNLQTSEILDFISKRNNIHIDKVKVSSEDIDWGIGQYDQIADNKDINLNNHENTSTRLDDNKKDNNTDEIKEIEDSHEIIKKSESASEVTKKYESVAPKAIVNIEEQSNQLTQPTVGQSEEEQNLDRMLPEGVKNNHDLEMIIKSGSIPQMVAAFLYYGVKLGASDVHIEATENNLRLRYRIDGVLQEIARMPLSLQAPIISRIKILAKLKIDEQRVPQDGRIDIVSSGKQIDLRISTLPTIHGEKCVMRLLDKTLGLIPLDKLGIIGVNRTRIDEAINKPYGIILVTGPTGSGKTTTLYAILKTLNKPSVNIITLEDPVEYELSGINQCYVKPKIGFGFADGLRSILRQDPNIIMVGEIRDGETANMATHAALTGHLVLSTLHTNDSAGALPRLIDMGVEPYLITSSINAIIAQRLVRKLCDHCKEPAIIPEKLMEQIKNTIEISQDPEIKKTLNSMKFYSAKGCIECKDGYKGRIGLYEVLSITDRIEQLAVNRATSSVIQRAALNQGLVTLRQDGFAKAAMGMTTIDEVIRVTK